MLVTILGCSVLAIKVPKPVTNIQKCCHQQDGQRGFLISLTFLDLKKPQKIKIENSFVSKK